jgi:hypothetical protein
MKLQMCHGWCSRTAFFLQVAMARLFIKGKDYGPHAFVVPIRDMHTHLPLPGIKVGDIGPKFGYNGVDNGFLSFNHVRVPRDNMLMRFAKARASMFCMAVLRMLPCLEPVWPHPCCQLKEGGLNGVMACRSQQRESTSHHHRRTRRHLMRPWSMCAPPSWKALDGPSLALSPLQ